MSDTDLLKRLDAIHIGMTGNAAFPNPPVDMVEFKKAIDEYNTATTEALDGGKKAISARQQRRDAATRMATLLGHYAGSVAHGQAEFDTSGFLAVSARTSPQPLPPAGIDWIERGPTNGSILLRVRTIRKAASYELRFGVVSGGTPDSWTSLAFQSPKTMTVNNLTPGANYAFQVRALGRLGYTDWSDPATFICG